MFLSNNFSYEKGKGKGQIEKTKKYIAKHATIVNLIVIVIVTKNL